MSTTATAPADNEPLPIEASQPQTSIERTFAAGVWQEGERYVAQALQIDVASQGETVRERPHQPPRGLGASFRAAHFHRYLHLRRFTPFG